MSARLLFVHALSPVHAGSGASIDAVELPIAREKSTGIPYLPGSGIKGALRDKCRGLASDKVAPIFGPDTASAAEHAGSIVFGDACLLALPVRTLYGTFAWVTSPYLLARFRRDAAEAGLNFPSLPNPSRLDEALLPSGTAVVRQNSPKLYLDDLDFDAKRSSELDNPLTTLAKWALGLSDESSVEYAKRFAVVSDDAMSFLWQHATQVVTRVSLDEETKTVRQGHLWTEELLPTETLLYALIAPTAGLRNGPTAEDTLKTLTLLTASNTQLGGKATVGRGRCQLRLAGGR
jgi:CRISPR-associated protein Cmr4